MLPTPETLSLGLLLLRLMLGVVFFAHGTQKVFGWFGGYGVKGTYDWMTQTLKVPPIFAYVGVYIEFVASIALLLGLLTKYAALALTIQMVVATFTVHRKVGFFMNWGSAQNRGEGYEFSITLAIVSSVLVLLGGGMFSLDALLF